MDSERRRRLLLFGGAAVVAFFVAVLLQYVLLVANVTATAAEAVGVIAGVATAVPLFQDRVRPLDARSSRRRYLVGGGAALGGLLTGLAAAGLLLTAGIFDVLPAAGGAGAAYAGATVVRSLLSEWAGSGTEQVGSAGDETVADDGTLSDDNTRADDDNSAP